MEITMSQTKEAPIIVRNKDIEHIVNAAANLGHYGGGTVQDLRFALLITTDVHRCRQQIQSAVDYLNGMEALDAGICLGDIQGSNFIENDGTWFTDAVRQAKKPFYTVVGNHDGGNDKRAAISGTKQQVFDKFFAPTLEQIGIPDLKKTYYAVNFDAYRITLIVLDNYDVPDVMGEDGDFAVTRSEEYISQEQADWLVRTLAEVPKDYHVMIARHSFPDSALTIPCSWTEPDRGDLPRSKDGNVMEMVPDIVHAWMHGGVLNREYTLGTGRSANNSDLSVIPPVTVNADFTDRGQGIFIGYIIGHEHRDWQGKCQRYPDQGVHLFASSANDTWQNHASDLPRMAGTKAEDCITVFTVDTRNRRICMVRVGSNVTNIMTDRTYISFKY